METINVAIQKDISRSPETYVTFDIIFGDYKLIEVEVWSRDVIDDERDQAIEVIFYHPAPGLIERIHATGFRCSPEYFQDWIFRGFGFNISEIEKAMVKMGWDVGQDAF